MRPCMEKGYYTVTALPFLHSHDTFDITKFVLKIKKYFKSFVVAAVVVVVVVTSFLIPLLHTTNLQQTTLKTLR